MAKIPSHNLVTASAPWGNWVNSQVQSLLTAASRNTQDQGNTNKSLQGSVKVLAGQINLLQATTDSLAATTAQLQDTTAQVANTVAYLNGLKTVSANGVLFSSGDIPGDATNRYIRGAASVTLRVPTGRMLVTVGCGQCTLQPGSSSAQAQVTFETSASGGWGESASTQRPSTLFLTNGTFLGTPLVVNKVIEDVPTDRDITITQYFGHWSSSANGSANAQWAGNYLVVQVLDD